MTDQVTIANQALALAGSRNQIANLQENSKEAQAVNLWYNSTRDSLLRAAHWNFARKQIYLSLLNSINNTGQTVPPPWVNEYAYPGDCVAIRYLMPQFQSIPGDLPGVPTMPDYIGPPVRFIISADVDANNNDIKVILTNQDTAIGVYTKQITNESLFDSTFVDAFGALLASRICVQLTGDKALAKSRFDLANGLVREAQKTNGNEGLRIQDVAPDWMRVRGYASDWAFPDGSMYFYGPQALTLIM
jgi:hypothetical protein